MLGKALTTLALTTLALAGLTAPAYAGDEDQGLHPRRHHDDTLSWSQWVFNQDRSTDRRDRDHDRDRWDDDSGSDSSTDDGGDQPAAGGGTVLDGPEQTIDIELTGYGAPDNNPRNSKTISMPVIHQEAGGSCSFADPVTFASPGSAGSTEFPKGTRVYFPSLQCYGISEDSGASKMGTKHIDIYTGDGPASVTDDCESDLTGPTTVIVNPVDGKPVVAGPLSTASGCTVSARGGQSNG